jgi:Mg2+/Co2+ transporter CorB
VIGSIVALVYIIFANIIPKSLAIQITENYSSCLEISYKVYQSQCSTIQRVYDMEIMRKSIQRRKYQHIPKIKTTIQIDRGKHGIIDK